MTDPFEKQISDLQQEIQEKIEAYESEKSLDEKDWAFYKFLKHIERQIAIAFQSIM
jgi:hypothetical protein